MRLKMLFCKSRLFQAFVFCICFTNLAYGAPTLPPDEVQALKDIAKTLGKNDWNFNVHPCSGLYGFQNAVTCNCAFSNGTICHVISIVLKDQNLQGTLPPDVDRFPYLREIDFSRNYLSGTIPTEWGSAKLVNISLSGNRLIGQIPKELANISSLVTLSLECNQLSGPPPPELGNCRSIEKLLLSSNNFNGTLPATLGKLTTLKDFRISDNQFTGSIPKFIQNWTKLEKLVIQASGLDGPIPDGIAQLIYMTDLRISDLNGGESPFPLLINMQNLQTLILRSCNIVGNLPGYLGNMTSLQMLDLSFNKLTGGIPSSFVNVQEINDIFFTGNMLTGSVPNWMLQKGDNIDISYNNFANEDSTLSSCGGHDENLFASSSTGNKLGIASCLESFHCPKMFSSLHINCGGGKITSDGNTVYEDDTWPAGASSFHQANTNWAISSTGLFMDDDRPNKAYIWTNSSRLFMSDPELYMNARLSPLSLTYYSFCLLNGNYTINLHFSEIVFASDKTYSSLGRRIFDVYIQKKLVLKDFNIAGEAGGVDKTVIKNFTAIVSDNSLEIRFYWAGKGTTSIPYNGVYGPLISAISVNPDFVPPVSHGSTAHMGTVAAIVGAIVCATFSIIIFILWKKDCQQGEKTADKVNSGHQRDMKVLKLQVGSFTLKQIKIATNNFSNDNKIGEGGFGSVYKGRLPDSTVIAVKKLSSRSSQGTREFVTEVGMISALQHPNLIKLYGCCVEGSQLILIYEYMENNSLAHALFGTDDNHLHLDWPTRHRICVGLAKSLAFLHEESLLKIVHRDIKATNVLLDKNLNSKISDFGMAKLHDENDTHISTRIAGTYGYMAPEYAMHGHLTEKADVYSFGVVALEIASGRSNNSYRPTEECFHFLDRARALKNGGNALDLIDPRLENEYDEEQVMVMINVALACTNATPTARPAMSSVVQMLEGREAVGEMSLDSIVSKRSASKKSCHIARDSRKSDSQVHSISLDVPYTDSSTNSDDLYPICLDTDHVLDRN